MVLLYFSLHICCLADPYVKIWLLYRGKRVEKKKTPVIKNTLHPNFSQSFTFQAPMGKLRDIQLEIAVMDYDAIGRNDTIGKVKFFSRGFTIYTLCHSAFDSTNQTCVLQNAAEEAHIKNFKLMSLSAALLSYMY